MREVIVILRDYQVEADANINSAWRKGHKRVLYLSGTGTGKTVVFSHIMKEWKGICIELSHRKELVDQASITLAKRGVKHSIIAPMANIKLICKEHIKETGKCFYDPNSNIYVASLKTLLSKSTNGKYADILNKCSLWVIDECHHALKNNQYGQLIKMMPNSFGLGVTATSQRTDGKGLGSDNDGLFDVLVEGPPPSWMMGRGYLTDYKIVAPLSKVQFDDHLQLKTQFKNDIVGDAVQSYIKYSWGKIGATFCSSVELSKYQAQRYNEAGIPAEHLDGTVPTPKRNEILRKLARGEIWQLCNVDLVSEGFDLPALSTITICRLTTSLIWHLQVSGRVLRPAPGKEYGLIIDHVGNYLNPKLGLPDTGRVWTLGRRDKKSDVNDGIPTKRCNKCLMVYERFKSSCPFCGHKVVPVGRTAPDQVDGDLTMLTPEMLKKISAASHKLNKSKDEIKEEFIAKCGGNKLLVNSNVKRHVENQKARDVLVEKILKWRYNENNKDRDNSECYREFYLKTGTDVLSAQGLKTAEIKKLMEKLSWMTS